MSKDYFKRLMVCDLTSWDLNCRNIIHHTPARNRFERKLRRKARRVAKQELRKECEAYEV